jgi:hypothetical protein
MSTLRFFPSSGLSSFGEEALNQEGKTDKQGDEDMKTTIEKILAAHGIIDAFNTNEDYSVKIENKPYLALCIEKHGSQITITHYFEQSGDLIPDPDMEFENINDDWSPVALQLAIGTYCRAAEYCEGKRFINPRQLREQRQFAKMWARNLLAQGFGKPKSGAKIARAETC